MATKIWTKYLFGLLFLSFLSRLCQSLSVSATKMQDFKQLAHNCWQSSYLPFEDSVITSHFITQNKVRTTKSIDYYGRCHAMLFVHIITAKTGDNVGRRAHPDTNYQERASDGCIGNKIIHKQGVEMREKGDKCRRRRGRRRKCWQRVKVKER